MHAKVTLIDGQAAVIGSHNFDARSDNFNLEFDVRVNSPESVSYTHLTLPTTPYV